MAVVMAGGVYYEAHLRDYVSPAIGRMMGSKERYMANLRGLQGTLKRTEETTSTLRTGIFTLGRAFISASIMSFVFHLTQRRLIYAQERVRTATEDLEKAIRKYGEGSVEVERASRRLSLAQTSLAFAQREANLQTFLMVMQLAPLVTRFYQAFTSLMKMNIGVKIGAFFLKMYNAVMTKTIILKHLLIGGAIGVAIALGTMAVALHHAGRMAEETNQKYQELSNTIGSAPSTGLVKGVEDLTLSLRQLQATRIEIGGLTVIEPIPLEEAIEKWTAHIKREWRALRR